MRCVDTSLSASTTAGTTSEGGRYIVGQETGAKRERTAKDLLMPQEVRLRLETGR